MSSSDRSPPPFARVFARGALHHAWDHVAARSAGPGIDRVTVPRFARDAARRLERLHAELIDGRYRPKPAMAITLESDPDRPIAVSCVVDRIVQRALAQGLGAFYASGWLDAVCAYRKGRGVEDALARVEHHLATGRRWFARTDIARFFDEIDRSRLLAALTEDGIERPVLDVVRRLCKAGIHRGSVVHDPGCGIGQGSALSPLLSNIYLRPLDRALTDAGQPYLRYADDILVLGETESAVVDALDLLDHRAGALGLRLNARKTRRGHVGGGFDFLGFRFDTRGRRLSTGAARHLRAGAAGRLGDPTALASWAREWARWYGEPSVRATSLPVLAAVILTARSPERVIELARVRLAERAPLPAVLHLALVEIWSTVDAPDPRRALVLDAHGALVGGGRPVEPATVARSLGVSVKSVSALVGPLDGWPTTLGPLGQTALAAIARELTRPVPEPHTDTPDISAEDVGSLLDRIGGQRDDHLVEQTDHRGHLRWVRASRPLTAERVMQHLAGGERRAVYVVTARGRARCATLDIRVRREALRDPEPPSRARLDALDGVAHDHALTAARVARRLGWPVHIERLGPRRRRLWLLLDAALPLRHVAGMLRRLEEHIGDPPPELIRTRTPAIDRVSRGRGPRVSLPLGRDPKTGARATWLDGGGQPTSRPLAALLAAASIPVGTLADRVAPPPVAAPTEERPPEVEVDSVRGQRVLDGCAVIGALAAKAARLGRLEGIERATLFEALSHLPASDGADTLVPLLEPTGDTQRGVTRRLARTPTHPISCPAIRKRHDALAAEVGCACRFGRLLAGSYPTPALHACAPREIAAFVRKSKSKSSHAQRSGSSPAPAPAGGRRDEQRPDKTDRVAPSAGAPSSRETHPPQPRAMNSGDGSNEQLRSAQASSSPVPSADSSASTCDPTPAPAVDTSAFAAAFDALRRSRDILSRARRASADAERELDALFDAAGREAIEFEWGRLRRHSGTTHRFTLEL